MVIENFGIGGSEESGEGGDVDFKRDLVDFGAESQGVGCDRIHVSGGPIVFDVSVRILE